MDPFLGLWYGLNRAPWQPEDPVQRQRLADLLDGYTRVAAYVEFQENRKGMLRPGMLADLVLLNADIFAMEEDAVTKIHPLLTMVDGKPVFRDI